MFLLIDIWFHAKNKEGLIEMLKYLNYEYKIGTIEDIKDDKWKVIYNPAEPMDINKYPNKLWLFGPHFNSLPDEKNYKIDYKLNNLYYVQPSQWVIDYYGKDLNINMKILNFPVNMNKFTEIKPISERNQIIIYYKSRKLEELKFIIDSLSLMNITNFRIFSYNNKYSEEDFLNYIQNCKYGIIVDAHESQGFAIEEMMSCNVPLLVWNVKYLSQEVGSNYPDYKATSIPYWDERCGEYFYEVSEFNEKFKLFINNLDKYKPREFVKETLSVEKCSERLQEIIVSYIDT